MKKCKLSLEIIIFFWLKLVRENDLSKILLNIGIRGIEDLSQSSCPYLFDLKRTQNSHRSGRQNSRPHVQ